MIASNEQRIGVYVCHCGTNIAHTVDVGAVVAYASTLPGVAVAKEYRYMCSDPGQEIIKRDIQEEKLTRVVVASCSPLMHEETFRKACEEAGLNRFLFQMANIREHCSWVHSDRRMATAKAKQLVSAAVCRVRHHVPLEQREVPVRSETMVVGAGIAGIEAALRIAESGKKVYLIEKEPSIGGHMAKFDKTFPTLDCAACILTPKMVNVGAHPNIQLMSYSEVDEVSGYVGNFKVKVRRKARYVDEDKCTGCGECVRRCPTQHASYPFPPALKGNGDGHGVPFAPDLEPERKAVVDRAVETHRHERASLISVLQDVNNDLGYLPEDALRYVSYHTRVPLLAVYHVATFYKAFSLTPRGKHVIRVCMGTACHVRGAPFVLEAMKSHLGIEPGETTEDGLFTLETVNCLGTCAMGPVVIADDEYATLHAGDVHRFVDRIEPKKPVKA
jgi:NADH:ubiquinone oxidoreductase subunit E/NAD-dependent dihydropyrimidine dehydrogenase PreA subunit